MSKKPLQKGDEVVMHTCVEAERYFGRVWTVRSDGEFDMCGHRMVMLEGFGGSFSVEFLKRHIRKPFTLSEKQLQKITPVMKDFLGRLQQIGLELQNHKEDTVHFTAFDRKNEILMRVFDNYGDLENPRHTWWSVDFDSKTIGIYRPSFKVEPGSDQEIVNRLSELYIMATEHSYHKYYKKLMDAIDKLNELEEDKITLPLLQRTVEINRLTGIVDQLIGAEKQ